MKATKILRGLTLFVLGMVVSFGIVTSNRHNDFNKHAGIRKSAVIEVGAPLTFKQLQKEGLI
jgi:hypothetical protein